MPQGLGRNLYPTLSVFDNIDFFGRLFGQGAAERHARIDELLKATGLDPFPDRPCGKLSGGMKQKVSLCCSLMHDPDLLVLDEPTTGVDPLSRRQFWELIDSIRARRPMMSVIVATAYMDEASRFDWLAGMDDGKIIAQGTPKEILAKAQKTNLDDAFIALLPPEKRGLHQEVIVRPRTESDDKTPAIEADGLTRRFGKFVAVDHVSFRIGRGEIFGFLGSNGCGKTTTMKMMTGLLPVTEGSAKLFGKPMGADDMEARQSVGYMSQAFSLYGELTVRQNLELHAHLYHLPATEIEGRIEELLERYDLKNVADAKPESLPLGVKQRLQLAVAVLHRPSILILDEPTSGVDPVARDAFWRTLIDLSRNDGVTIFLSTHFMNEAERCDRISLMHRGRVLAVGTPKELVKQRGSASLEDAFISYLEEAGGADETKKAEAPQPAAPAQSQASAPSGTLQADQSRASRRFDPGRLWAYARRETMELLRDPITAVVRVHRSCHFDVRVRLRHHLRCREPQLRSLRPGPHAGKPQAARRLLRLTLFLRTASDQLRSRAGATHAERRAGCRGRNPIRFRSRCRRTCTRPRSPSGSTAPCRFGARRRKDMLPAWCCVTCRTSRSSVSARTPYPTSILAASISKIASATTRVSKASSPWCPASL